MSEINPAHQPRRSRRIHRDPLLKVLGLKRPPKAAETLKVAPDATATGEPPAGRSTIEEARRKGPLGFLQVLGPGLITGASDDDPSGIGTYSQVGSQFGYGLLWTALFTFPLMAAVQELCSRIALQTGVGLGVALRRRYPTGLVGLCIMGVFIANTINIGADLGAIAAGVHLLVPIPRWVMVIVAAGMILALQILAAYTLIFKIFKWLTVALFAYVITAFLVHPAPLPVLQATFIPHIELSRDFVTALIAVLGTTISPYLFFWQASSEVDVMRAAGQHWERDRRGVRNKELRAARADILVGMLFSNLVMFFIILTSAAVLHGHGQTGIQTADQAASALKPLAGPFAALLFAAGMIGTGLLAIPILSGSAAYALKEFLGIPGTLASRPTQRPTFYIVLAVSVVAGVAMNFMGIDPIGALFWTAVINGVASPPLLLLLALLGQDREVMKERVSGPLSRTLVWSATVLMSAAALAFLAFTFVIK